MKAFRLLPLPILPARYLITSSLLSSVMLQSTTKLVPFAHSTKAILPYVRGDLTIDYPQRRVTMAGRPVALTAIEYRMLVELSVNAGRALTHERLLQRVWGPDRGEDSGPVRNIVKRLRRKLGDDPGSPTHILTEPRFGYRMEKGEGKEREET